MGGNAYYLSARSNHLSIGESFGYAVAGAWLWEYFGEVDQSVSANDVIVTPFTGIGIGEPATQLSAFFDRQRPTLAHRTLATIFSPLKSLNDVLDGVTLSREPNPRDDWHRFSAATSAVFTHSELKQPERTVSERTELRVEISERLARLTGYDSAAHVAGWFDDGNVSSMSLGATLASRGLRELEFKADALPAGYYQRDVRSTTDGMLGNAWLLGFQVGYGYHAHDYHAAPASGLNRAVFVKPLGAVFEYRGELGKISVASRVSASALYGGVHPIASEAYGPARAELAAVVSKFDYYFAAGGEIETSLSVRVLRLEADLNLLGRSVACVDRHVQVPISDSWQRLQWGVAYRIQPAWSLRLYSDDSLRTGRMGAAHAQAHERALGLETRANF